MVGDDVVQLAGDLDALLHDGPPGLLLLFPAQLPGELAQPPGAVAGHPADDGGDGHEADAERADAGLGEPGPPEQDEQCTDRTSGRNSPLTERGDGVQREREAAHGDGVVIAEGEVAAGAERGADQDGDREAAAEHERQVDRGEQAVGPGIGVPPVAVGVGPVAEHGGRDPERADGVHDLADGRQRGAEPGHRRMCGQLHVTPHEYTPGCTG
nr:hypothetical protein [Streptomyces sp. XY332]